jgi:hypothetical protein
MNDPFGADTRPYIVEAASAGRAAWSWPVTRVYVGVVGGTGGREDDNGYQRQIG